MKSIRTNSAGPSLFFATLALLLAAGTAWAQTTSFTYQGKLSDGGTPANGNYDLQFTLWDAASFGTQQPQPSPVTVTRSNVAVSGGIFTVQLDFTVNAFPGADRFLEISVRPSGGGSFTMLSPRQQISSTPYALRSLGSATADLATNATNATTATNATQLGGVAANQYVLTSDSRLSDARAPTPGSSNYIQNTTSPQSSSDFNISGNGTAGGTLSGNVVNATTEYDIGGSRFASSPGTDNTFVGPFAGQSNTTGTANSFFGSYAGAFKTSGGSNSFFGIYAGQGNSAGTINTALGAFTTIDSGLSNATAIGANAHVTRSNSVVLGDANANVGIGITAPDLARLQVLSTLSNGQAIYGQSNANNGKGVVGEASGTGNSSYGVWGISTFGYAGYFTGNVYVTGTVTQGSDARFKRRVADLRYGLREVMRLRPVSWTWKEKPERRVQLGLIAQEAEAIVPELVTTSSDAEQTKGINYIGLVPVVIKAMQEQQAQIKEQQKEIETLRNTSATLSNRLQSIEKNLRKRGGSALRARRQNRLR